MSNSNFTILTCDGGGIRGLITAMIIQKLDEELHFLKQIDLFVGTSTGGLIALGLASGVPISKLVNIYGNSNCSQIFTPYQPLKDDAFLDDHFRQKLTKNKDDVKKYLKKILEKILKPLLEPRLEEILEPLWYVKYDNTGLRTVLQNNLKQPNQSLADLRSKVLVTTFQLDDTSCATNPSWKPITLDNLPKNEIKSEDTLVLDAALCTSAAPTYFPPYEHPAYGLCVDGGVFANNPSTLALARVLSSGILGERSMQDIRILSIGTGQTHNSLPSSYQPGGPLRYGPTTWLWPFPQEPTPKFPLLSILMESSSTIDDFQTKMFLGDRQYQRMNIELTKSISLDSCSEIELMKQLVSQYIESPEWNEKKTWIKNNFLKK